MFFTEKLKETSFAVLPVSAIVYLLALTVAPLNAGLLIRFGAGSLILILGLSLFLTGAEVGIMPAGSLLGASLTRTKSLPFILASGFLIGFIITVAEPDLIVLGKQVEAVTRSVDSRSLVLSVALGIGFFVSLALARTLFQIPLSLVLVAGYAVIFLFASLSRHPFAAIAFDSGGATTGPMTVPFIIALGVGMSSVRGDRTADEDRFGYIGIASMGPILAVCLLGFFGNRSGISQDAQTVEYAHGILHIAGNVATALGPVAALIFAYNLFLMKLPREQLRRLILGFIYAFLGLVLFFYATDTAFIPVGKALGEFMGMGDNKIILILTGCVLGAVVVCAEPAIWLLCEQVEEISRGNIRKPMLLTALAIGVSAAVGLSLFRILWGFSIWYLLIPVYAAALLLMAVTPKLFTAIAFDSGGVASGPMSSTFILSLTIGAASSSGNSSQADAFGLIAMIAAAPIVSIQALGWLYSRKHGKKKEAGIS